MTLDTRLPRYQQLSDLFKAEIAAGSWRVGDAIPTEAQLAESHQAAVGTIRKAIDTLVAAGLLERFQGRGTFVKRPSFQNSFLRFFRFGATGPNVTVPAGRILTKSVQKVPRNVASALGMRTGQAAIRMERLRLLEDQPILLEEIWLPLHLFEPILAIPDSEIGDLLYPAYETLCGQVVASADEALTASAASKEQARSLMVEVATPLIVIDRVARDVSGHPIEWRRSWGGASRFRYEIRIR
jgi:GntR family transcriptional regulator